jgi:hypothetical protein
MRIESYAASYSAQLQKISANKADAKAEPTVQSKADAEPSFPLQDIVQLSGPGLYKLLQSKGAVPESKPELGELVHIDTTPPWQIDPNETTYEKYGDSNLLHVHNTALRNNYYRSLFVNSTDQINSVFGLRYGMSGWDAHTVELSVARYEELRGQVTDAFGDNPEELGKNLASLEAAFTDNLQRVAHSAARYLRGELFMKRGAENTGNDPLWDLHPLTARKELNLEKFEENARNLMTNFAQEYLRQSKTNAGASAWQITFSIMSATQTTSVNALSFSDFLLYCDSTWSTATTRAGTIDARNQNHMAFLGDERLSDSLQKILLR